MATSQEQNKVCDAAEQVPMVSGSANCDENEVSTKHSEEEHKHHKAGKGFLRSRTMRLSVMLALTSSFFLVELIVGHHLHAMSLIADSFHMLSDVLAITIGLVAIRISKRPSSTHFTFGWKRAEVIGALVNSVFLCALCFSLVIEASQRFFEPEKIKQPLLMLYVGGVGLLINIVGLIILHFGGGDVHNHGHSHGHNHADHNHKHDHDHDHDHEHDDLVPSDAPHNGKENHSPCLKSDATSNDQLLSLTKEPEDSKISVEMRPKRGSGTSTEIDKSPNRGSENELSVPNVVIQMNLTDAHKLTSIVESQSDGNAADAHSGKGKGSSPAGGHNMRAVFMHVLGDALGSVIVIVSATVVWLVDAPWTMYLDPALSLVIVLIISSGTIPILRDTLRILLETVPRHIRIAELRDALTTIPGVLAIHEFHVWQLQSDVVIASVHVSCASLSEYLRIGPAVKRVFHDFNIHSTTVQPEFVDNQSATVQSDQADNRPTPLNNERSKDLPGASTARSSNPPQSAVERSMSTQFACTLQCDSDGICQRQTCCSQPVRAPAIGHEGDTDAPTARHSLHSRPNSKVSHSQLEDG